MAPARGVSGPTGAPGAGRGPGPTARPRPRRRHWSALLLLLPLVELLGIILVGQAIGGWWTLLLLALTAVLGVVLVRREGRRTFRALQQASRTGGGVSVDLANSGLVLTAGVLLVLPGFLTDVLGLLLLVPAVRPITRVWLRTWIVSRAARHAAAAGVPFPPPGTTGPGGAGHRPGPGRAAPGGPGRRGPDDDVIEGEILDEEPPR